MSDDCSMWRKLYPLNGRRGGRSDLTRAALTAREHNTKSACEKSRGEIYFFHRAAFCGKLFAAHARAYGPPQTGGVFSKIVRRWNRITLRATKVRRSPQTFSSRACPTWTCCLTWARFSATRASSFGARRWFPKEA